VLRIYADYREKASNVPDFLRELGAVVIFENLTVADYVISETIGIERKSVEDLVSSVFDKRFFDQLSRLSESYKEPYILIEGDLSQIRFITTKWKAVNSALVSAIIDYDLRVLFSLNKKDSAEVLYKLAEKISAKSNFRSINLHDKPKFENLKDIQLYVVESLPNVGEKLAKKLLEKFNTIENICKASISDLEKALGSRKRAEEIYKVLHTAYSSDNGTKKNVSLADFLAEDRNNND